MDVLLALLLSAPGFPAVPGMSKERVEAILNERSALTCPVESGEVCTYFRAGVAINYDKKGRAECFGRLKYPPR